MLCLAGGVFFFFFFFFVFLSCRPPGFDVRALIHLRPHHPRTSTRMGPFATCTKIYQGKRKMTTGEREGTRQEAGRVSSRVCVSFVGAVVAGRRVPYRHTVGKTRVLLWAAGDT